MRTALRKFGAMYGCIWKSSTTYRNCCIIYLKSKKLHKHYIYSERWLINKAEMLWHLFCLFVPSFHYCCWFFLKLSLFAIVIMLILMGFHICYACCYCRTANSGRWLVITVHFCISTNQFFKIVWWILLEYWLFTFQFCVEVKPANYYSSVSTSAVSSLDIKENILVEVM